MFTVSNSPPADIALWVSFITWNWSEYWQHNALLEKTYHSQ